MAWCGGVRSGLQGWGPTGPEGSAVLPWSSGGSWERGESEGVITLPSLGFGGLQPHLAL